jgi:hypothetical protein
VISFVSKFQFQVVCKKCAFFAGERERGERERERERARETERERERHQIKHWLKRANICLDTDISKQAKDAIQK